MLSMRRKERERREGRKKGDERELIIRILEGTCKCTKVLS